MRPARKARERGVSRDTASECNAAGGDAAADECSGYFVADP